MSNNKKSSGSAGITTMGLLQVALIVLKLCSVIDWSWWWVLAPLWGGALVALLVFVAVVAIAYFGSK